MKPAGRPGDACRAEERERDRDERRAARRSADADGGRREGAHQELALGADVEQAGLEAEADGQAGEHQRRRVDQGVDDRR